MCALSQPTRDNQYFCSMTMQCYIVTANAGVIHIADYIGNALANIGLRAQRFDWHVVPPPTVDLLYTCHVAENGTVDVALQLDGHVVSYSNLSPDHAVRLVTEDFDGTSFGGHGHRQLQIAQHAARDAQQQAPHVPHVQHAQGAPAPTTVVYNNCTIYNNGAANDAPAPQYSSKKQRLLSPGGTTLCKQCGRNFTGAHACGGDDIGSQERERGRRSNNVGHNVRPVPPAGASHGRDGRHNNIGQEVRRVYPASYKQKMIDEVDKMMNCSSCSRAKACRWVKRNLVTLQSKTKPRSVAVPLLFPWSKFVFDQSAFKFWMACLQSQVHCIYNISPNLLICAPPPPHTHTHAEPSREGMASQNRI